MELKVPKMTVHDDPNIFLESSERTALAAGLEKPAGLDSWGFC